MILGLCIRVGCCHISICHIQPLFKCTVYYYEVSRIVFLEFVCHAPVQTAMSRWCEVFVLNFGIGVIYTRELSLLIGQVVSIFHLPQNSIDASCYDLGIAATILHPMLHCYTLAFKCCGFSKKNVFSTNFAQKQSFLASTASYDDFLSSTLAMPDRWILEPSSDHLLPILIL